MAKLAFVRNAKAQNKHICIGNQREQEAQKKKLRRKKIFADSNADSYWDCDVAECAWHVLVGLTNERDFPVPIEPHPLGVAVCGNTVPRWRGRAFHQLTCIRKGKPHEDRNRWH